MAAGPIAVPPDAPVHVDATLERIPEGIVVRGEVDVVWAAECSRCLRPLEGTLAVGIDELFEPHPVDGETYLLEIVVFAARANALLAGRRAHVVSPLLAEERALELHHAGVGEQERRIVGGHP